MSAPAIISSGTAVGGPPVGGTGTTNTIPRWAGASTLGDSILSQDANARAVGIGGTAYTGWGAGQNALQVGLRTALADVAGIVTLSYNAVRDGATGNWLRIGADAPTQYSAVSGAHSWLYAASGAANSAITWTTGMTMTSAGNVGIGTASPVSRLDVAGTITCDDAGTGLKLPATPGNADTQTLDCYQEGTLNTGFTLNGVTASAGNVNYEARWVRIGRAVSLRLRIFPDAGAQITFAAGATVVMTGTPAATSPTAMATAANDGPSGRASALWDTNTVYLNTALTFGVNVNIYFNGTAV